MRISSLLLAIALVEMVAAGVYYGAGDEHSQRLDAAADNFNTAQMRQNSGEALPPDMLARYESEFDAAAAAAKHNDTMARMLGISGVLTAIAGGVALALARRRERAAPPDQS